MSSCHVHNENCIFITGIELTAGMEKKHTQITVMHTQSSYISSHTSDMMHACEETNFPSSKATWMFSALENRKLWYSVRRTKWLRPRSLSLSCSPSRSKRGSIDQDEPADVGWRDESKLSICSGHIKKCSHAPHPHPIPARDLIRVRVLSHGKCQR